MDNIRSDLINAKVEGRLQEETINKLSQHIKSFQDFSYFVDVVEGMDKKAVRGPMLAGVGLLAAGAAGAKGIQWAKTKKSHQEISKKLIKDPAYQDKNKVKSIYSMISQFAPKVTTNYTFSKSMIDQLYNMPTITAPMVKEITDVEGKVESSIPSTKDIISSLTAATRLSR